MQSREYWNQNLDTDNLGREGGAAHASLEESLRFALTPEYAWVRWHAANVTGQLVVDLGGGVGLHAITWAQAGADVVVVDLALERMKALREVAQQAGVADRIQFVVGAAENMPLRDQQAAVLFTKSVLIHTDLPVAAREIYRVLQPGGQGLFIEPLNRNPIIRLYRKWFAPKEWKSITRYFDQSALDDLREPFEKIEWTPFYLLSAGSFFWQYLVRRPAKFRVSLRRWWGLDLWILRRFPALREWCWFASIHVQRP